MNNLLIGLVGALIATNQPLAVSNLVQQQTGASVEIADPNNPVEKEFQKVMAEDDAAQAEVDKWIRDNEEFTVKGAGMPKAELNRRIRVRFEPVRKSYEDFIARHPDHARARLAYASFLDDLHEEDAVAAQLEKARELDPKNPAVWNNLANYNGHVGSIQKAFDYYARAIELNPNEPLYYQNYATTVYMFRKDAMEHFKITEDQVFDKALELYAKALKLDPDNFPLATDLAQTYYGIRPLRADDALKAWTNTLKIAHDEIEREGVYLHFARIKVAAGRFDEARLNLNSVTNQMYADLKARLLKNLNTQENQAKETNNPPSFVEKTNAVPGGAAQKN